MNISITEKTKTGVRRNFFKKNIILKCMIKQCVVWCFDISLGLRLCQPTKYLNQGSTDLKNYNQTPIQVISLKSLSSFLAVIGITWYLILVMGSTN